MAQGRPPLGQNKKRVTFVIDEEILAKYELLIYDPVAGRSRWGVKSSVVEKLLSRFLSAFIEGETTIDIREISHLLR